MLRSGTVYNPNHVDTKMSFQNWKNLVDRIVYKKTKMHCDDLPDEDYWMNWDKNVSPKDMAQVIFKDLDEIKDFFQDILKEHANYYIQKN